MHRTHQPCKQIWAHPLPIGHLLWQLEEGQPHLNFFIKKPNFRLNILDEGRLLNNESIA